MVSESSHNRRHDLLCSFSFLCGAYHAHQHRREANDAYNDRGLSLTGPLYTRGDYPRPALHGGVRATDLPTVKR